MRTAGKRQHWTPWTSRTQAQAQKWRGAGRHALWGFLIGSLKDDCLLRQKQPGVFSWHQAHRIKSQNHRSSCSEAGAHSERERRTERQPREGGLCRTCRGADSRGTSPGATGGCCCSVALPRGGASSSWASRLTSDGRGGMSGPWPSSWWVLGASVPRPKTPREHPAPACLPASP